MMDADREHVSTEARPSGRVNQRARTRRAIVDSARELIESGDPVTMPIVAERALVSEATAYRYFADLPALVREALGALWPPPDEMLRAIDCVDAPTERVAFAARELFTRVLRYEGSTRVMIAATITRPKGAAERPGYRFGLIDRALDPVADAFEAADLAQLKQRLAVVMSPESLFTLIDFCGLPPTAAVDAVAETAAALTRLVLE
jgi:AcrR family transcriptional regulator